MDIVKNFVFTGCILLTTSFTVLRGNFGVVGPSFSNWLPCNVRHELLLSLNACISQAIVRLYKYAFIHLITVDGEFINALCLLLLLKSSHFICIFIFFLQNLVSCFLLTLCQNEAYYCRPTHFRWSVPHSGTSFHAICDMCFMFTPIPLTRK